MCLKDHSIIGAKSWYQILNHEAWHVVQDGLAGGIHTSKMISLITDTYNSEGRATSRRLINKLKNMNGSRKNSWALEYADRQRDHATHNLEWEAVMVEEHPHYVLSALKILCDHTPGC